jgi:hypothetical protein
MFNAAQCFPVVVRSCWCADRANCDAVVCAVCDVIGVMELTDRTHASYQVQLVLSFALQ